MLCTRENSAVQKLFIIIYCDKTQHAHFQGKPIFQAAKQHLNNSYVVSNTETS